MTTPTQASAESEFRLLLEALRSYQAGVVDSGFKTLALMVGALGWFITSQSARDFLTGNELARNAILFFLALTVLAYAVMAYRIYLLSQSVLTKLDTLAYVRRETYEHYAVKKFVPIYYTLIHTLIVALMFSLVLGLPEGP
jgi:hypothetical protein